MSVGQLFFVIAIVLAFLPAAGIVAIPNAVLWVLFCMCLGFLLSGVPLWKPPS